MAPRICAVLVFLIASSCVADTTQLERGALGPAAYAVSLTVSGDPAAAAGDVDARLVIDHRPSGATLRLSVSGEEPITADLVRRPDERLELVAVEGVSPGSAGEADLASLVSQVDPPLPEGPVRLGQRWSSARSFSTDTLDASLETHLRFVRFARAHGFDVAELSGVVSGSLSTSGEAGRFSGRLEGTTSILWAVSEGRLVASDTDLRWQIEEAGEVLLSTRVRPT